MQSFQLALLLALAAQAASNPAPSLPAALPLPEQAPATRLGVFFAANISAACAGRCSLRASMAPCSGGGGDGNSWTASGPALLQPWNSVLLTGDWEQQDLHAVVHIDCSDPACTPVPASFLAWRSSSNDSGACAQRAAPDSMPQEPRLLPGLQDGGDQMFLLNGEEAAVTVSYEPLAAAALLAAPAQEALQACESQLQTAAACEASSGLELAVEPAAEAALTADKQKPECQPGSLLLLRLALAGWMLACAGAGAFL